jgi:hypothetical protein
MSRAGRPELLVETDSRGSVSETILPGKSPDDDSSDDGRCDRRHVESPRNSVVQPRPDSGSRIADINHELKERPAGWVRPVVVEHSSRITFSTHLDFRILVVILR